MGRTIKTNKAKRRTQQIEDGLAVESILDDDAFIAASGKKKEVKSEMEIPDMPDVNWDRKHNHRVPLGKKVFGSITYGDVERAIWKSDGMLTNVAKELKLSVYYVRQILMKYKLLRQDFEEYREALLDEAEMCLRAKIKRGDTSAMIFFLKCVGKGRGYVEYERAGKSKGSVKMKIVPATDANIKKQMKKDKQLVPAKKDNVVPLFKTEKAEGTSNG